MLGVIEKLNHTRYGQVKFTSVENNLSGSNESKDKLISQGVKITGTLAGLAVLGYAGVKAIKGKGVSSKGIIEEVIPQDLLAKFRNWLIDIKDIKAMQFVENSSGKSECVSNPEAAKCLSKLDNLTPLEKRAFVQEYCNFTGFPNLDKITDNINKEITGAVKKIETYTKMKPLFVGYERNSSVGRALAFPGSDCDGLILVFDSKEKQPLFNEMLMFGDNINQRLVNISGMHYPDVFGFDYLKQVILKVDKLFANIANDEKIAQYEKNLSYDGKSFVKAAQFNIDIAKLLDNYKDKNEVCWAGFFVENLRSGKVILNNIPKSDLDVIKNSALYKYSNMYRQEGLKDSKIKPKLESRIKLCNEFSKMNDEEKFGVCKGLLKSSLGIQDNNVVNSSFEEFDMGDIIEMYKKISSFFNE